MLFACQVPSGQLAIDQSGPIPKVPGLKWRTEYAVDGAGAIQRVSPIFPSAASLVQWLQKVLDYRREAARTAIPRARIEDLICPLTSGSHELGIGSTHQYEGYLTIQGNQLPPLLFRGDASTRYALIPTLTRCLWPAYFDDKVSRTEALRVLVAEQKCTSAFVNRFFTDRAVLKEFPWARNMEPGLRSAIARHHGFFSWLIDFTVDPEIAAFFATGAGSLPPEAGSMGSIWVADESYITDLLGHKPHILKEPGYETRGWNSVDAATIERNASKGWEEFGVNRLGEPAFWDLHKSQLDEGFSLSLNFAPGTEIERMWNQKWCAVEPNPPMGDIPRGFARLMRRFDGARKIGHPTIEYVLNCQMLFQRLCSRLYFIHDGTPYQAPDRGVSATRILPHNDPFALCIESYGRKHNLLPGTALKSMKYDAH